MQRSNPQHDIMQGEKFICKCIYRIEKLKGETYGYL